MRSKIVSSVLAVIGILVSTVPAAHAGSAGGGTPGTLAGLVPFACRVIDGEDVQVGATVTDTYGTKQVLFRSGKVLCTAITLDAISELPGQPIIADLSAEPTNALRCYTVTPLTGKGQPATPEPDITTIEDGLHSVAQTIQVRDFQFVCLPAIVGATNQ